MGTQQKGSERNGKAWKGTQREGSKANGKGSKVNGKGPKVKGRARNAKGRLFETNDDAEIREKYQTFRSYNFFIIGLK